MDFVHADTLTDDDAIWAAAIEAEMAAHRGAMAALQALVSRRIAARYGDDVESIDGKRIIRRTTPEEQA